MTAAEVKQKERSLRTRMEKAMSDKSWPEWKMTAEGAKVNSRLLIWRLASEQIVKERAIQERKDIALRLLLSLL